MRPGDIVKLKEDINKLKRGQLARVIEVTDIGSGRTRIIRVGMVNDAYETYVLFDHLIPIENYNIVTNPINKPEGY